MCTRGSNRPLLRGPSTSPLDLSMFPASFEFIGFRGWTAAIVAAALAELGWFLLLYPLVPRNISGGIVEALLLVPVALYIVSVSRILGHLSDWAAPVIARQGLAILLVVSAVVLFGLVIYWAHRYLGAEFGFGIFLRR